jgi:fatty-acyl-CoA synthase
MFVPLSVLEFRDRAAAFFGDKIAVVDGERRFTYREYAERTHRLANALVGIGVEPGDRVSFITYNTHQLLEAYYGVLEAGAVLNPINVRLAPHEIAFILDHSASRVVFYHHDFTPLIEAIAPKLMSKPRFVVMEGEPGGPARDEFEALVGGAPATPLHPALDENAVAELFYTSGTTGWPKGVALTHRTLHLHAVYALLGLGLDDSAVVLHVVPLFHVNGWGSPHWLTLAGGRHVMLRKFDPVELMTLVQREKVTHLLGVPTIFNALINHPRRGEFDLTSLKLAIVGGAPSSPALIAGIEATLGPRAIVGYGLSETSPIVTLATPRSHLEATDTPERSRERRSWTGWAVPGVRVRVVDAEDHEVPADGATIGEIVVRSNVVMESYYRDVEATERAIRDGWFHTGDMAVMGENGYVLIKDRSKDIIIRGGENISSVEIENALYAHLAVLECAVVAAPDEQWGESPVAFVVLKPAAAATAEDLTAHCRATLAGFKVPREFVFHDALPKGGTGKILKAELREPYWAGRDKHVA